MRPLPGWWRATPTTRRSATSFLTRDGDWYLEVLGVRPGSQRQGLGTRLIQPVLDQADTDGEPCFLETSDRENVPYYERFGFSVIDDDLHLVPNGPTHVAMCRLPRP